jgi:peptide chain release factor 1
LDIHAGEGGEDSRLFAKDLLVAYVRYAQALGFLSEIIYDSDSSWSLKITGDECWEYFKYESGKHVVQRVPPTESRGRRHTSIVSVAVLSLRPQIDTRLPMDEIEIIAQRGHGKGGQHQNKVSSAIRAVHKPTGIRVFINGRDQYQNKQLALEILAARVAEGRRESVAQERNRSKVEQLGFGTRSGKIRTYNFINGFVINHRTGQKTKRIEEVMKGKFDLLR